MFETNFQVVEAWYSQYSKMRLLASDFQSKVEKIKQPPAIVLKAITKKFNFQKPNIHPQFYLGTSLDWD
jgi:hypothetical protein